MSPRRPRLPATSVVVALFTSRVSGLFAAAIGAFVLVGWGFDLAAVRSVATGAVEMKANTAFGLLLSGVALYLLLADRAHRMIRPFARLLGALVAILGLATLGEYLLGWQLGIDELLFRDPGSAYTSFPGRMSPYSAVAFAATGLALATMRSRRSVWLPKLLVAVVFGIAVISLLGYIWNAAELRTDQVLPPVAIHTAFAFLLLAAGIYFAIAPLPQVGTGEGRPAAEMDAPVLRGFVGGLVVIVLLGGLAYRTSVSASVAGDAVIHTHEVRSVLSRIRAGVADAEFAHLFAQLTGTEDPGQPLEPTIEVLFRDRAELFGLVEDNPRQLARAGSLSTRVDRYVASLRTAAAELGRPLVDSSRFRALLAENSLAMAALHQVVDSMAAAEERLLDSRLREAARQRGQTLVTLLVTVLFAIIGYLIVLRGARSAAASRIDEEDRLRLANLDLGDRVTERTAELMRTERRFADLFESAPDALLIVDETGCIAMVNRLTLEMFGWGRDDLVGQRIERLIPPALHDRHVAHVERFLRDHSSGLRIMGAGRMLMARRRDGSEFRVEVSLSPLDTAQGRMVTAAVRDITERVALEQQVQQSQRMETIGHLAGGIAHDFNNLITIINSTAEMAGEDAEEGSQVRKDLQAILDAGRRAAAVTRQLLAFGRKQLLQAVPTDLSALVREMRPILTRLAGEAITVELHLADGLPTVVVDPGQIEQVILNLAVNSRDAMPDGGELRIETALTELDDSYVRSHHGVAPGPHLRLTISDTGVGMDRETAGRIFEPFFTTKSAPKGTGLGLSTAYGIIKQSNGDIWVYSEPGEGTTFKIYLPIGTADDAVEHVARDPQLHASHGGETILVVEDEPELRRVVVRLLTEAGYRVMEAGSMIDALAVAAGQGAAIDLLLTDVMMPGGNGHQLAEALRATEPGRGTRVLYMSGYTDEAIVHHGVLDPGVDFISKPYTVVEIKAKVREVLDR